MTSLAIAPAPLRQLSDFDISHEVCCVDETITTGRISMCGLPIPDGELDDDVPTCAVCTDLLERWAHYADLYGEDPVYPGDEPCRVCPRRYLEAASGHP